MYRQSLTFDRRQSHQERCQAYQRDILDRVSLSLIRSDAYFTADKTTIGLCRI